MKWRLNQPLPNSSKPETSREPLQRRDAEIAEISAEKGKNRFNTSGAFLSPPNVFSALPLRSLRLCVELTASLTTSAEAPCPR
jgi:hypothetical protein